MMLLGLTLAYFLQNLIVANGMMLMLKWKYGFWAIEIIWQFNTILLIISKVFPNLFPYANVICPILYLVTQCLLVFFMFEDRVSRMLLAIALNYTAIAFSEVLVEMLNLKVFSEMYYLMYENDHPIRILIMMEAALFYLLSVLFLNIIWHRNTKDLRTRNIIPAMTIPLGQSAFIVAIQKYVMFAAMKLTVPMLVSMVAMDITDIFWIFWIIKRSRYEQIQRDLASAQQEAGLEKIHMEQVHANRHALHKICLDYEKQLEEILTLVEQNHTEEAAGRVDGLAEKIRSTKETPYCDIPVINAILTAKDKVCKEENIAFNVEIDVQPGGVDALELCSIFGNLMDNAIVAVKGWECEKIRQGNECNKWIRLSAGRRNGYLVIKIENPSLKPVEPRSGHGYGSRILKAIAEKYEGEYVADYHDGRFTAVVTLVCERGGAIG